MPGLAVTVEGQRVPKSLQQGDVLNVLSGNLDGSMLYVVAWLGQGRGSVYEGWIHGSAARMLSKAERRRVPKELRLPINEVMKRSTFVEVTQNWSNMHPDAGRFSAGRLRLWLVIDVTSPQGMVSHQQK